MSKPSNLPPGVTDRMIEEQAGGTVSNCSICGKEFTGFGHNPEPVRRYEERCCGSCNQEVIVPVRIFGMTHPIAALALAKIWLRCQKEEAMISITEWALHEAAKPSGLMPHAKSTKEFLVSLEREGWLRQSAHAPVWYITVAGCAELIRLRRRD